MAELREITVANQVDLRVDPVDPAATRIGDLLGTPLPVVPNTGSEAVLWLGVAKMVAGLHSLQPGKGERP